MSWPLPKKWNIKEPACGLAEPDRLTISGTDIYLNKETSLWGKNLAQVSGSSTKSTFDADGGVHNLEHDEANRKLMCTYPAGSLAPPASRLAPLGKGSRRDERPHPHYDPHTGGTMTSWTAEEGS